MNKEYITAFLNKLEDHNADYMLVQLTSLEMSKKLAKKRTEGRSGWYGAGCDNEYLFELLKDHIDKGDMIDVMNFAAMIYVREQLYGDE